MNNRKLIQKIVDSVSTYPDGTFAVGKGRVYTCVNPFSYHLVRTRPQLYESMDGLFVDGMIMCWLIRILWRKRIDRHSFDMTGMAADLFSYLNNSPNRSIYFIGTKHEILEKTITQFRDSYPNMNIIGYRNGYFADCDKINVINEIIKANSDFTIVGMGAPLQEQFGADLKKAGYKGIIFTCGGFLHQSANNIQYYPNWINKYNLRAFYRLFHEKNLCGRLYNVLIEFPVLFTWDTFATKWHRNK